jgi:hypothetical protein
VLAASLHPDPEIQATSREKRQALEQGRYDQSENSCSANAGSKINC